MSVLSEARLRAASSTVVSILVLACSAAPEGPPSTSGSGGSGQGGAGPASGGTTSGGQSSGGASNGGASTFGGSPSASGGMATSGGAPTSGGMTSASGGNTAGGNSAGATSGGSSAGGTPAGGAGGAAAGAAGKTSSGGASGASSGGAGGASSGGAPTGGVGGGGSMKSTGCGTATNLMLNRWVDSSVMVSGKSRPYAIYLPTGYDPTRAYPVLVLLHGCSSGTNNLPMERQTGTDAILIRGTGSAADTCWDTSATGPDVAFFDAMVADVKTRFCADTKRFFAVGYSSGAWLANRLGCIRADVLRAAGTVAGGNPGGGQCVGPFAHMFVHDKGDTSNGIAGSESARDRLLTQNHCDKSIQPVAQDPSPCVRYQGCDPGYPVVFCATTGQNHNRQDALAAPAFWKFFKEF